MGNLKGPIASKYCFEKNVFKVTGDSLHQENFMSTEPFVSRQKKLL